MTVTWTWLIGPARAALAVGVVAAAVAAGSVIVRGPDAVPAAGGAAELSLTGPGYLSGAFLSGSTDMGSVDRFGEWRGRPAEVLVIYAGHGTWQEITASEGLLISLADFDGQLAFSLPLLPLDGTATLADVAAGRGDEVFRRVAEQLAANGREDAIVRIGWEGNVEWPVWAATAANADAYRAAVRRAMGVVKQTVPSLRTEWDLSCGRGLDGGTDRLDALNRLYPGDDVTDIIGCDQYDAWAVQAGSEWGWQQALRPDNGVGLDDMADFARARGKELAIPAWALSNAEGGGGDNAAFIRLMHGFFEANAEVLAYEAYWDEPSQPFASALWGGPGGTVNPRAAAEYRRLW